MQGRRVPGPVLVLGTGDVGSAVAHALFARGLGAALHDGPAPSTAPRRGMAFADAHFDGRAVLAGVVALRLRGTETLAAALAAREGIPFLVCPIGEAFAALPWAAVVDARMCKRAVPEDLRGWAPTTVGLGPGFVAGDGTGANGSVSARAKADATSSKTSSAYAATRTASAAVARRR
jgi:xanthine dehydrogenase accessory factor